MAVFLQRRVLTLLLVGVVLIVLMAQIHGTVSRTKAANPAQATPIPITFPTEAPTMTPTGSPTRTPTLEAAGQVFVEALDAEIGANVRAGPDIGEGIVGKIFAGNQYKVLGKRFEWYQIEFPDVSGGVGWVHESVVNLIGDDALIQQFETGEMTPVDPTIVAEQQTANAVLNTPGAFATLTAQAQITPTGVFTADAATATWIPGQPLPTFTPPGQSMTPPIIPQPAADTGTPGATLAGVPTLVPILALTGLGLLGLLISMVRRL